MRLVMRQAGTLKVIANHSFNPKILPVSNGDRSLVWIASDIAKGEPVKTTLSIKFASTDMALEFSATLLKFHTLENAENLAVPEAWKPKRIWEDTLENAENLASSPGQTQTAKRRRMF